MDASQIEKTGNNVIKKNVNPRLGGIQKNEIECCEKNITMEINNTGDTEKKDTAKKKRKKRNILPD